MAKTLLALVAIAGLVPATALAGDCAHTREIDLALDLDGVRAVAFEAGRHDLAVRGAPGAAGRIAGQACASSQAELDAMRIVQSRRGDTLVVALETRERSGWRLFGSREASFDVAASLPASLPVEIDLGSGDATVSGVASLTADVGSGDLQARGIAGTVAIEVGSGDIELHDIGALRVRDIGSGDVEAERVRGDVTIGDIGSGDFSLAGASGNVELQSLGSGDVELRDVAGGVRIGSVGSGDIEALDIGGDLVVRSVGSGEVEHHRVRGRVDLPTDH